MNALFIACLAKPSHASEFTIYRNNKLGFELTYPNTWEVNDLVPDAAFSIKNRNKNEFGTLSVSVANFTMDAAKYWANIDMIIRGLEEKFRSRFPDAEIIERGETFLGGHPAYIIATQYTIRNLRFEMEVTNIQVQCIRNSKLFILNFETPNAYFQKNFLTFQAIAATFNFR
jgi:hypothetical protein